MIKNYNRKLAERNKIVAPLDLHEATSDSVVVATTTGYKVIIEVASRETVQLECLVAYLHGP